MNHFIKGLIMLIIVILWQWIGLKYDCDIQNETINWVYKNENQRKQNK